MTEISSDEITAQQRGSGKDVMLLKLHVCTLQTRGAKLYMQTAEASRHSVHWCHS